jgi:DNA-binding SARP family transcriptional activator
MALAGRFDPGPIRAIDARPYHLRLLDGFHLEHRGLALATPHAVCRLIAFLGLRARSSRMEVAGTLWPEVPESKAHASLRSALWRLRQMTVDPLVVGGQALHLASTVEVDVATFRATAQRLLVSAPEGGPVQGASRLSALGPPINVGDLLPGWYEDWVLFERERLRQLRMHVLETVSLRLTSERRHADAIEAALAAVRLEPLRESATRVLILAHLAEHNIVEAVRSYEVLRDGLRRELGVEPTPDLKRLALGNGSDVSAYEPNWAE